MTLVRLRAHLTLAGSPIYEPTYSLERLAVKTSRCLDT
jgi:hypothetical protein